MRGEVLHGPAREAGDLHRRVDADALGPAHRTRLRQRTTSPFASHATNSSSQMLRPAITAPSQLSIAEPWIGEQRRRDHSEANTPSPRSE